MSAIFGVVGAATPAELMEMSRRLGHRGPQSAWHEVAPGVFLGQLSPSGRAITCARELAIVVDGSHALDYGSPDCVADSFAASRDACDLDRLKTPFTLAAWDERMQCLWLARDFLGLKPLHYCRLPGGGVAFATEYKALLALHAVPAVADLDALQFMQIYKAVPPGKTLLRGIEPVPPGCVMQLDRSGEVQLIDHMPPIALDVRPISEAAACTELLQRLRAATAPMVAGRSSIGLALSGGIDSLSTAFLARSCAPQAEFTAFTAGHGPDDPEVVTARRAMEHLKGAHQMLVVSNEELSAQLPLAVWHLENPIGRSETFQFLSVGRMARKAGFDFLLSGMGADLLFGGMPRHKVLWMAEAMPFLAQDLLAFFSATQTGRLPDRPLARAMMRLYYRGRLPEVPSVFDAQFTTDPDLIAEPGPEFINRCLMLDGQEPTSRTLARIERPLQAFGVEYGSPYLDKSIIQFAFTLPSRLKIRRGKQKYILRQAMRPLMSDDLRNVPKDLMRMSQNGAFAHTLQQLADRYLNRERVLARGFFDLAQVNAVRSACRGAYHPETAMRLWTLIVSELWAEIYIDGRGHHPFVGAEPAAVPERATERAESSVPR